MEAGARPGPSGARANKGADKDEPPRVSPPVAFGIVEPRVYRSNVPTDASFEFLQGLGLKNALIMSPELPTRRLRSFFESNGVGVRHLGLEAWRPQDDDPDPLSAELLKEALEFVLDGGTHPLLILCSSGLHATGVLVGCLRRLQRWNLTSIFQVIPPVPSLFTLLRPYLAHFFPVFSRFLRVFTASTRRFQQAPSRNPGPRNSRQGNQEGRTPPFVRHPRCQPKDQLVVVGYRRIGRSIST